MLWDDEKQGDGSWALYSAVLESSKWRSKENSVLDTPDGKDQTRGDGKLFRDREQ